jgi:hypothetical protein
LTIGEKIIKILAGANTYQVQVGKKFCRAVGNPRQISGGFPFLVKKYLIRE